MDQPPFQPRFLLSALAVLLIGSALVLVAAAFSGEPDWMMATVVAFMAVVTASTVLIAREMTRVRQGPSDAAARIGRLVPRHNAANPSETVSVGRNPTPEPEDDIAFRRAQKAEAVDRLRDGIVHDLNNRLMVISANIDAVARQMKEQPILQRKLLSALVAADQAAALLARSTAFSRQQGPHVENIDLGARIQSVAALLSRSLLRDTVELRVSLSDNLWPVAVDPDELETAIVTLSAHARDALAQGGAIRIEASNQQVQRGALSDPLLEGDFVRVMIDSSDGSELPVAGRARADAFSPQDLDKGASMTLNRGLHFLHRLGGATEVRSNGNGLTITLYLRRADLPARLGAAAADDDPSPSEKIRSALEILVVDDEVEVALAVQTMLEEFGYVTHVATDPGQALRSLRARTPELVLMDVSMPGTMSGVMLAREVRQSFPDLPIVLFTGNPLVAEEQSEFPLLHKPIVSRDLHAAIQRELRFAGEVKVVALFPNQARRAP
ncbi:response regulator [Microvirga antarctica]|uniref:response regulator n=1 Tax=Microvirga antarctica TaxID=2819233 RepID=UPI001B30B2A7|nr:response regulator [Microvirga antarctica]